MGHPCWLLLRDFLVVGLHAQLICGCEWVSRGSPTLAHLLRQDYWCQSARSCCCAGFWVGRIDFMDELAGASASSAASALTIPSITRCDCLSRVIFKITSTSFCGSLTAKGLSKAVATACRLHSSLALNANEPVRGGAVWFLEFPVPAWRFCQVDGWLVGSCWRCPTLLVIWDRLWAGCLFGNVRFVVLPQEQAFTGRGSYTSDSTLHHMSIGRLWSWALEGLFSYRIC